MNQRLPRILDRSAYTVGWLCVLPTEVTASRMFLDEEYAPPPRQLRDETGYIVGRMGNHYVVIAFPLVLSTGSVAIAHTVVDLTRTFYNIRFGLMIGIGGGAPSAPHPTNALNDIHLGDVVVSQPSELHGGVLQYDKGRWTGDGKFEIRSYLARPPRILLGAVALLQSNHQLGYGQMMEYLQFATTKASKLGARGFSFPGRGLDRLYKPSHPHKGKEGSDCSACGNSALLRRHERRSENPAVHYGIIASGNAVMRSVAHRDHLRDAWGIKCFEMEAAGLGNELPCLVIRGISDYSDNHKNDSWQPYAALVAAAYAKDLLRVVQP